MKMSLIQEHGTSLSSNGRQRLSLVSLLGIYMGKVNLIRITLVLLLLEKVGIVFSHAVPSLDTFTPLGVMFLHA